MYIIKNNAINSPHKAYVQNVMDAYTNLTKKRFYDIKNCLIGG